MYNNQFFQENPDVQWIPYQQGPIQHPQHQMHRQERFPRWHAFHHQQQQQMYHRHMEQDRQRQLHQQQQLENEQRLQQHHQFGQEQRQHQQRDHQQQLEAHQQGGQHVQQHHQPQFQLHMQPRPEQHQLHQYQEAHPQLQHQNQQHHHHQAHLQFQQIAPNPQTEPHQQQYQAPHPLPQPQPQEPHQHQHLDEQLQQLQLEGGQELHNFNVTHQIIAPPQPQQGVEDNGAHLRLPQLEQGSLDDEIQVIEIEEIQLRAGPSNTNGDLPAPQKRRRTESGVDAQPAAHDAQDENEQLRERIRQKDEVIHSQQKMIEELSRKLEHLQCGIPFPALRTIKVEAGEGTSNAPHSSSPSLQAIGPCTPSPVLAAASPPQIKRIAPRVKEEPRTPSPAPDQVQSYEEACVLWRSKYADNVLAKCELTLDLKEYLFHPGNSRTVPQEVKNVRPHCIYKSLHPDKGNPNLRPWNKMEHHEKEKWQDISRKIQVRQLRQEREGMVLRKNGKAVPVARSTFNPYQVPYFNPHQPHPVPHLFQNVFRN